jgi:hypothetical protein
MSPVLKTHQAGLVIFWLSFAFVAIVAVLYLFLMTNEDGIAGPYLDGSGIHFHTGDQK